MSKFVNLHVHSHYSLLDGLITIDKLVNKAKAEGQKALALTDHGVMYGAVEFYKKCLEQNIKPIIGCEVYVAPRGMEDKSVKIDANPYHLVLLAKNNQGYKNLMEIVSQAHLKGYYYKPRVDKKLLKKYSDNLIASSACLQGEVARKALDKGEAETLKVVREYQGIFGKENFYLEIQPHFNIPEQQKVNKILINLNQKFDDLQLVATKDTHYLEPSDQEAHEVLLCVGTGRTIDEEDRMSMAGEDFSFSTYEEMKKAFPGQEQAIRNTVEIAEKCNLDLDLGNFYLPKIEMPEDETDDSYLEKQVYEGAKKRYGEKLNQEVEERIEYELGIIKQMGYSSYFLIVADFVNYAKEQNILVGPGRGSAAGSIVAYSLQITDIDPLKYDLLFERFLNPERVSQPDIDLDFADDRRDEVIKYVGKKYGHDKVAQIITFGKMEARAAVRDVTRALGLSYDEGDQIAKLIPFGMSLAEALESSPELKDIYEDESSAKRVLDMAKKLEGVARHASVHAAGVVISKGKLTNYTPLQLSPKKDEDEIITQYSMYDAEDVGLVKMDFLGLSNLTILQNTLDIIRGTTGKKMNVDDIPLDDKKTYRLLQKGQTTGVFQLASDGMKRYLKELKPTVFEDIIAMVALYRPGPMDSITDFIEAKHGRKKVRYLHPKLKPILEKTYGVITYQEQVFEIARELAGFSYGEADILRKAVGKKIRSLLEEQKEKFIKKAIEKGLEAKTAKQLWDFIEPFAEYGFNKSHAACYGLIAYWTAYLKANYPSQFMAALLTNDKDDLDKVARDINECQAMDIEVLPPDVNESFVDFGVVKETGDIRFGLSAIKNVGDKAAELVVEERKKNGSYDSLESFASRLAGDLNKKILENLAQSGALSSLERREAILNSIEEILDFASREAEDRKSGQANLFGDSETQKVSMKLNPPMDISDKQKLNWEKELLGIYVSRHPLDEYKAKLDLLPYTISDLAKFENQKKKKRVVVAGIITSIKEIMTKKNQPMMFVGLEDLTGELELIVFPSVLEDQSSKEIFKEGKIVVIQGNLTFKDGQGQQTEAKILVEKAKHINKSGKLWGRLKKRKEQQEEKKQQRIIKIKLNENFGDKDLYRLKEIISKYEGGRDKIELIFPGGRTVKARTKINYTPELKEHLNKEFSNQIELSKK
jgi:DNA polymerase-3 subunit alpha